jgi:hypothetical protein
MYGDPRYNFVCGVGSQMDVLLVTQPVGSFSSMQSTASLTPAFESAGHACLMMSSQTKCAIHSAALVTSTPLV